MQKETWMYVLGAVCAASLGGCGSSSYGTSGTASTGSSSSGGGTCSGATPVSLTVKNFDGWCSVAVAGGTASSSADQTACVAAGSVSLTATANAGFELGSAPWHDTSGDKGSGDPGTVTGTGQTAESATTVTVQSGSACVWVCCPFSSPAGTGCPTTNQCP